MGTTQSVEEGDKKCPLPGKPFVATANNVVNATEKACNRAKRIKEKLLMQPEEVMDTVPTIRNKEMNEGEPLHPSTSPSKPVEMTWREKRPSVEEGEKEQPVPQWRKYLTQKGGMKAIKKLHVKELRELLKENRIKITNKGKYLSKKQMLNKLKMIKWN